MPVRKTMGSVTRRVSPQPMIQAEAIQNRHLEIRQQQIGALTLDRRPSLFAIGDSLDFKICREKFLEEDPKRRFILSDQQAGLPLDALTSRQHDRMRISQSLKENKEPTRSGSGWTLKKLSACKANRPRCMARLQKWDGGNTSR